MSAVPPLVLAMEPAAVQSLVASISRTKDPAALLTRAGERMKDSPMVQLRGDVAIIPIIGVLTRRDSWRHQALHPRPPAPNMPGTQR